MASITTPELLIQQAKKLDSKWLFFSSYENKDKAVALYMQAAAMYKNTNMLETAAKTYECAGNLALKIKDDATACKCYSNAADIYMHDFYEEAMRCYKSCILLSISDVQKGKYYKLMGDIQLKFYHGDESYKSYDMAERHYRAAASNLQANAMLLKMADLSILKANYVTAYDIYDQLIKNETYYSSTTYIFKACISAIGCVMKEKTPIKTSEEKPDVVTIVSDKLLDYEKKYSSESSAKTLKTILEVIPKKTFVNYSDVSKKIDEYKTFYPRFADSREYAMLDKCVISLIDNDIEQYNNLMKEYSSIIKLDKVYISLFTKIKKQFTHYKTTVDDVIINTDNKDDIYDLC